MDSALYRFVTYSFTRLPWALGPGPLDGWLRSAPHGFTAQPIRLNGTARRAFMALAAAELAARLDRLPMTRHIWYLVTLISLGGCFELYDLFLTAYIAPGLNKAGYFTPQSLGVFNILGPIGVAGIGTFVFSLFAGLFVGAICLGHVADNYGRRSVFTFSLVWYSITTAIMAFQDTGFGVNSVALRRRHRHRR